MRHINLIMMVFLVVPSSCNDPDVVPIETPDCFMSDADFDLSINGYCQKLGNQQFEVQMRDDSSTLLYEFSWPGLFQNTGVTPEAVLPS